MFCCCLMVGILEILLLYYYLVTCDVMFLHIHHQAFSTRSMVTQANIRIGLYTVIQCPCTILATYRTIYSALTLFYQVRARSEVFVVRSTKKF